MGGKKNDRRAVIIDVVTFLIAIGTIAATIAIAVDTTAAECGLFPKGRLMMKTQLASARPVRR